MGDSNSVPSICEKFLFYVKYVVLDANPICFNRFIINKWVLNLSTFSMFIYYQHDVVDWSWLETSKLTISSSGLKLILYQNIFHVCWVSNIAICFVKVKYANWCHVYAMVSIVSANANTGLSSRSGLRNILRP